MNEKLSRFSKTAGPGILFASTAIGVSHLVQSTRAGADFGLLILGFVILVTLLKYPFFKAMSFQIRLFSGLILAIIPVVYNQGLRRYSRGYHPFT